MLCFSKEHGGYLSAEDLSEYSATWVEPISLRYKGYEVWEIPPNGQGITALMSLGMLANDSFKHHGDIEDIHRGVEAIKLAFADTMAFLGDPEAMSCSSADLLNQDYLRQRRQLIGGSAREAVPGTLPHGGTVYLAAADSSGLMVSFIQSNYMGFGSGLVVPNFGISLNNRGHCFTLEEGHPNRLEGRKRPYHTIIPGFLTRNEKPIGPFGIMGGFMQPQAHLQIIINFIDYGLNPQAALDAPRWQWLSGKKVILEPEFQPSLITALRRRGHEASLETDYGHFGRGQIISVNEHGVFTAGTEKRCDGHIAAW